MQFIFKNSARRTNGFTNVCVGGAVERGLGVQCVEDSLHDHFIRRQITSAITSALLSTPRTNELGLSHNIVNKSGLHYIS